MRFSLRRPSSWLAALLALLAGCSGGSPPTAHRLPPAVNRPPYLVYEVSGREITVNVLGRKEEHPVNQRISACAVALRSEDQKTGAVTILRLDRKLRWDIDPQGQGYTQVSFAEAAAYFEQCRKELTAQLQGADLTPAKRRSLDIIMGRCQPEVLVKTDPAGQVNILGHPCRHLSYLEDGELRFEAWVAEDLVPPCDLSEFLALVGDFSPDLLRRMGKDRGFRMRTQVFGRMLPQLPQLNETQVTRLETPATLSPALFEVPPGCKLIHTRARARPPAE